jgi:hypothetical protein
LDQSDTLRVLEELRGLGCDFKAVDGEGKSVMEYANAITDKNIRSAVIEYIQKQISAT